MRFADPATPPCTILVPGARFVCDAHGAAVCSNGDEGRHASMLRLFARFPAAAEHGYADALNRRADTIQEKAK